MPEGAPLVHSLPATSSLREVVEWVKGQTGMESVTLTCSFPRCVSLYLSVPLFPSPSADAQPSGTGRPTAHPTSTKTSRRSTLFPPPSSSRSDSVSASNSRFASVSHLSLHVLYSNAHLDSLATAGGSGGMAIWLTEREREERNVRVAAAYG